MHTFISIIRLPPVLACAIILAFMNMASSQPREPNYLPDLSQPMDFRVAFSGGNCNSCQWIAAQGMITQETPKRFKDFLVATEGQLEGTNIHFNSLGGDLGAALRLGRMIREVGYATVVAETAGNDERGLIDQFLETDDPVCVSACVFAFVGGLNRAASTLTDGEETGYQKIGRLGVHQFYSTTQDGVVFDPSERSKDQVRTAVLLEYLVDMGVSADLLAKALSVPPEDEVYWLNEDEVIAFNIDTFASSIAPQLRGYSNGVGVIEVEKSTRRGSYRYEFYCDSKGQAALKLSLFDFEIDLDRPADPNSTSPKGVFLGELEVPLPGQPKLISSEQRIAEAPFERVIEAVYIGEGSSVSEMRGQTKFAFGNGYSSYTAFLALDMNFKLPEAFDGFYLLPRLCIK